MMRIRSYFPSLTRRELDRINREFKRKFPEGCVDEQMLLRYLQGTPVLWKPIAELFRKQAIHSVRSHGFTRLRKPSGSSPTLTATLAARWLRQNGLVKPYSADRALFRDFGPLGAFGIDSAFAAGAIDLGRDAEVEQGVVSYFRRHGYCGNALKGAVARSLPPFC
jgi:hypothetical protein